MAGGRSKKSGGQYDDPNAISPETRAETARYFADQATTRAMGMALAASQAEKSGSRKAGKYRRYSDQAFRAAAQEQISADTARRQTQQYKETGRKIGMTYYPPKGAK